MKILIGYDGSPCGEAALDDLMRAGLPRDTEAIVLSVADVWPWTTEPAAPSPIAARVSAALQEARVVAEEAVSDASMLAVRAGEKLQAQFPEWSIETRARANSPAWGILLEAEEAGVDLILVGSHGRSALGRWLIGSVSQTVVTQAKCSVRVAREHGLDGDRPTRILVGVDGSQAANAAVRAVAERTWPPQSDVRVVTAIDPALRTAVEMPDMGQSIHTRGEGIDTWVDRLVDAAATELEGSGLAVSTVVVEGDPKHILVQEAERVGADSIFVGARGLNTIDRLLLGSVSMAVTNRAHCSVEIVRAATA